MQNQSEPNRTTLCEKHAHPHAMMMPARCDEAFWAYLEQLCDSTLVFSYVLHVEALMEVARIGTDHGGC